MHDSDDIADLRARLAAAQDALAALLAAASHDTAHAQRVATARAEIAALTAALSARGVEDTARKSQRRKRLSLRNIWARILNTPISVRRGYTILAVFALIVFVVWMGVLRWEEQSRIAAVRQRAADAQSTADLRVFYDDHNWLRRGQATFAGLAAEFPSSPWPLIQQASIALYETKWTGDAIEFQPADQALALAQKDSDASTRLAALYFLYGNPDRAIQAAEQAIRIKPDTWAAYFWLGQAHKQLGDLAGARNQFEACAASQRPPSFYQNACFAELLPASRELTITLKPDLLTVDTRALLDPADPRVNAYLRSGDPAAQAQDLAWGFTQLAARPQDNYFYVSSSHIYSDPPEPSPLFHQGEIIERTQRLPYQSLWNTYNPDVVARPLTIGMLPLTAYTSPTTLTVVLEDTQIISSTVPFAAINGNTISWRVDRAGLTGQPLHLYVLPPEFQRLNLLVATNLYLERLALLVLYMLPAIWATALFVWLRMRTSSGISALESSRFIRAFYPESLLSWLVDGALVLLLLPTVFYPAYMLLSETPFFSLDPTFIGYIYVLGIILVRLAISDWRYTPRGVSSAVHLGAIIFIFYLVPRIVSSAFGPIYMLYMLVSGLVFYLLVMRGRHWLERCDWSRLSNLFGGERASLIRQINEQDHLANLEEAVNAQDLALAKGSLKPDEYRQSREIIDSLIAGKRIASVNMHQQLGIPAEYTLRDILFRAGPSATPLGNAVIAVAFGLIPYLIFTVLASYRHELYFREFYNTLSTLVGVPWGPIYLFFFGAFYRAIWGGYGITKGLAFGGLLAALNAFLDWTWSFDQLNALEVWGITLRLVVTFVFTGVMMDWAAGGFSWRTIRRSYDSPALTTIYTILGTVITTIIVTIATGTANQLLSIVAQGLSASLGVQPPR